MYARHYDGLGRITRSVEDAGVGGIARTTDYAYDRYGRLTRQTGYTNGTSGAQHTDYAYTDAGVRTRLTYPDDAGGDRGYVEFFVDAALRLTKVTDQEGQDTTFAYDVMSRRLTTTRGTEVDSFTYTDWGAIDTAQRGTSGNADAVSKVDRYYDALNQLTRESQAIKESAARNVDYAYDLAGNVAGLTYPSGVQVQTSVNPSPPKPLTPARLVSNFLSVREAQLRLRRPAPPDEANDGGVGFPRKHVGRLIYHEVHLRRLAAGRRD